jgi:hypothetical protein
MKTKAPPLPENCRRYAEALATMVPVNIQLSGRGHAPRISIDRRNPLVALLPHVKVAINRRGDTDTFASASYYRAFQQCLMAAGIDLESHSMVYPRAWPMAWAVFQLTGEPLWYDDALERRANRNRVAWQRRVKAEQCRQQTAALANVA